MELTGFVTATSPINVYSEENFQVICQIPNGTYVLIDEEQSTKEFYKICTSAGIEGYCLNYNIRIQE